MKCFAVFWQFNQNHTVIPGANLCWQHLFTPSSLKWRIVRIFPQRTPFCWIEHPAACGNKWVQSSVFEGFWHAVLWPAGSVGSWWKLTDITNQPEPLVNTSLAAHPAQDGAARLRWPDEKLPKGWCMRYQHDLCFYPWLQDVFPIMMTKLWNILRSLNRLIKTILIKTFLTMMIFDSESVCCLSPSALRRCSSGVSWELIFRNLSYFLVLGPINNEWYIYLSGQITVSGHHWSNSQLFMNYWLEPLYFKRSVEGSELKRVSV